MTTLKVPCWSVVGRDVCSPTVENERDRFRGPCLVGDCNGDSTSLPFPLLCLLSGCFWALGGVKELENQVSRGLVLVGLGCVFASGPALFGGVSSGYVKGAYVGICSER
jgi:hypothetical protein